MSTNVSKEVLSIATLGRPFHLGMLYDCRSDKILPGITLWDKSTLEEKSIQKLETADFEIIASDTIDDKASALDINVNLKLSFLGGLVNISGSGKYLDNRISSSQQERVTLKYKCTTRSEEMTMDQLGKGKIEHPDVFDHGTATHVVTGITYGGNAFFVFDREISINSTDKEIEGHLNVIVNSIPGIKIDGKGDLELSENEKKNFSKFSCKYFGDFLPLNNPSNFEDAVRLYKDIPKLIGKDGANAVPIKASLYPLIMLDSKASRLVKEISTHLVRETEETLENLYEFDLKCNDLLKSQVSKSFPNLHEEIQSFKSLLNTYKLGFQKKLSLLLPCIRGGGKEESELADILQRKELSPFSQKALTIWIRRKEGKIKILQEYTSSFSEVKFASETGDLDSLVMSPNYSYVLCFAILTPSSNPHLIQMNNHICKTQDVSDIQITEVEKIPLKVSDDESTMMEKARHFRCFVEANKGCTNTAFRVKEESTDSYDFEAKVRYYKNGHLTQEDFEIPSAPDNVSVISEETTHDKISVKWDEPSHGRFNISKYKIFCENLNGSASSVTSHADSSSRSLLITGLEPGCEYQVRVQIICEPGVSLQSSIGEPVKTKPTSPPGKPEVSQISSNNIVVKWSKPYVIGSQCTITKYIVKQQQEGADWYEFEHAALGDLALSFNVNLNCIYRFKIYCDCGCAGKSLDSEVSDDFMAKMNPREYLKNNICGQSKLLQVRNPRIYQPELQRPTYDDQMKLQKFEFGTEKNVVPEKIILLVGATGSGKTTLINGLFNYIFSVNWKDNFRFKVIIEPQSDNQANSRTSQISSYKIHHQKCFPVPYTLTIIDTPGFGDVKGIDRDKEITDQIRTFFLSGGSKGIDHLDAVGFVAQSSLPRLTATQRCIFDQVLSLFGKDIADNIFLLLTFAAGQKPQVLSGINEAKMPYKKFFKFNNSALYACKDQPGQQTNDDDDDEDCEFDEMLWKLGEKSFRVFLNELNTTKSKSLSLTKDVLEERNQLEVSVFGIQRDIQIGLTKLEQLKKEVDIVRTHQADIDKNKDFTDTVTERIPAGQHITNCMTCNWTCHESCAIADDDRKEGCAAMTNGQCRVCPQKCHWKLHKNYPFKYVLKQVQKTKTSKYLLNRYEEAKDEFKAVQLKVLWMTEMVRKSLERLKAIELKPNPLSTVEYIDVLVQSERLQEQPGWQSRVQQLQEVRKTAEYMKKVADKGFDPFMECKN